MATQQWSPTTIGVNIAAKSSLSTSWVPLMNWAWRRPSLEALADDPGRLPVLQQLCVLLGGHGIMV